MVERGEGRRDEKGERKKRKRENKEEEEKIKKEKKKKKKEKTNSLVDFDTNGGLGDVPDTAGLTVVELVGHTLVNGTISLDVNNVSDLKGEKGGGGGEG